MSTDEQVRGRPAYNHPRLNKTEGQINSYYALSMGSLWVPIIPGGSNAAASFTILREGVTVLLKHNLVIDNYRKHNLISLNELRFKPFITDVHAAQSIANCLGAAHNCVWVK